VGSLVNLDVQVMSDTKGPGKRRPTRTEPAAADAATAGSDPIGWEARALAQVRSHVRELSGPGAAQAGWETDTITRLEDYFDRGDV